LFFYIVNPGLLKKHKPVEQSIQFLIGKYKQYIDKDNVRLMKKIWDSKTEMSKQYFHIVMTYIRKIRAFLFKEPCVILLQHPPD